MSELDDYLAEYDENSPEGRLLRDPVRMLRELRAAEDTIARQTRTMMELHADYLFLAEAVTGHPKKGQKKKATAAALTYRALVMDERGATRKQIATALEIEERSVYRLLAGKSS